jgi:hypothetical protein
MRTAASSTTPAYTYRPGDGHVYVWDRGPWIEVQAGPGRINAHIPAPDTYTATAMMSAVDAWRERWGINRG